MDNRIIRKKIGKKAVLTSCYKSSTLIEVIVASAIMMIIFTISMDSLSKLFINNDPGYFIKVETSLVESILKMNHQNLTEGEYTFKYDWGIVICNVSCLGKRIKEINIVAKPIKLKETFEYSYLTDY
jgi:hypothetical protein